MGGRLEGKVAVVTGAASRGDGTGNGAAVALRFAREGAAVVLVNRDAERVGRLAEVIAAEGGRAVAVAADVTDPEQVDGLFTEVTDRFGGRLDVLHNNVGTALPGTPETVSLVDWRSVLDSNLTSAMLCSGRAIPAMRSSGGGSIVMVSSISGSVGYTGAPGSVAYAAANAGLHGLTRSIAGQYASAGIRANCIVVGSVDSPMVAHLGADARARRAAAVPLGTVGTAWDIASGAVYLASDEARWVTGVILPIDGGFTAIRERPA
ncbi:SDR family NAD(P)-dependent oxidoreductase [Microbacterium sp. NPDC055357]